jgi:hypothetical protein
MGDTRLVKVIGGHGWSENMSSLLICSSRLLPSLLLRLFNVLFIVMDWMQPAAFVIYIYIYISIY